MACCWLVALVASHVYFSSCALENLFVVWVGTSIRFGFHIVVSVIGLVVGCVLWGVVWVVSLVSVYILRIQIFGFMKIKVDLI
jgi:hypothetical protein